MKQRTLSFIVSGLICLSPQLSTLFAQGTAFTYQGRLTDNGAPLTGVVELEATLWDAATNGNPIVFGHQTPKLVEVTNGLFTVELSFGKGAFPGPPRWVQIGLRKDPDPEPFTTLWPRQRITATPYAMTAGELTGLVPSDGLFGGYGNALTFDNPDNFFAGRGSDLIDLNASELTSGTVPAEALGNAWKVGGNTGITPGTHFLGTTDNRPLELRVNNIRALLLQPHPFGLPTVSVIGGPTNNQIASNVVSATIGGGFNNTILPDAHYATIVGGEGNIIQSNAAWATLAGGRLNTIHSNAQVATIGGGIQNTVRNDAQYAAIGGGFQNVIPANSSFATIPGGRQNSASDYAFAAGRRANAAHTGSFVWADSQDAPFASTVSNQFSVRASGGARFVTGGAGMTLDGQAVLSGTVTTTQLADSSVTAVKLADGAARAELLDDDGPGSGLDADLLDGLHATAFWQLGGNAGTTAGTHFLGTTDNQPLEFKVNGLRALRLEPTASGFPNVIGGLTNNQVVAGTAAAFIGGGHNNSILSNSGRSVIAGGSSNTIQGGALYATIAGGNANTIETDADAATIGGGVLNTNSSDYAVISGGFSNRIEADNGMSFIGGGLFNVIRTTADQSVIVGGNAGTIQSGARESFVGGGFANTIGSNAILCFIGGGSHNTNSGVASFIGSGEFNLIGSTGDYSAIGGGFDNRIRPGGHFATIPGGRNNSATNYAFAAGRRAKANHTGAFVWADSQDADFASTSNNQFLIRAAGGVGIGTASPRARLHVVGDLRVDGDLNVNGATTLSLSAPHVVLGENSVASGDHATAMGSNTVATAPFATVMGRNTLADGFAAVATGDNSHAGNYASTAMGTGTTASGVASTAIGNRAAASGEGAVALGIDTAAVGLCSFAGGTNTLAGGNFSIALGRDSQATQPYSFASGRRSRANHTGAFVWADSTDADFGSTGSNQFLLRASGGVGIGLNNPAQQLHVRGNVQLDKDGGVPGQLILRTPSQGDPGRYGIRFSNNGLAPFTGDDITDQNFDFYSVWSNFRTNDARLNVHGKANGNWGAYIGLSHDGTNGIINTDLGHIVLAPAGNVVVRTNASLSFGNNTRQMINLYNQAYGIGVQGNTLYFRTDVGYAWFRDGVHTNTQNDPGPGGAVLMRLDSAGNLFTTGAVNPPSDRNVKKDFAPVNAQEVLRKVAAMPLHTWTYTNEPAGTRHLGPVAQDFHAAFGVGADDKHIATVDADGVALAAIQGLHALVREKEVEIQKLKSAQAELERRLTGLEQSLVHPPLSTVGLPRSQTEME